jgi:hypothetical protein
MDFTPQESATMQTASTAANPFALLTDPESIFRAIEASQHLDVLNRRICRPLDRAPRGEGQGDEASHEAAAHDAAVDGVRERWSPLV